MANLTTNFNYLQPTSFKLVIDRKNYPNLEFFCQSFIHPGMIINAPEIPFRQVTGVPLFGSKLTFNELSANILLDEDMKGYDEMYSWIQRILLNEEKKTNDMTSNDVPTYSDITLSILSSHNNTTKQIRYKDCVPTSLGDITFESTADGTQFISFVSTFRFTYFDLL